MISQPSCIRQCPPLGHLSVRALTRTLMGAWQERPLTSAAHSIAHHSAIRDELLRRERLGVGVHVREWFRDVDP
jgi:hypothetical protein